MRTVCTGAAALALTLASCARAAALAESFDVTRYLHTAWTAREGFLNAGNI